MKGQAFIPDHIVIGAGTTVQWKNFDAMIHTVTAVDKSFNSGTIAADGSYMLSGKPQKSFWTGLKVKGREVITCVAYRCKQCGLVELYAH